MRKLIAAAAAIAFLTSGVALAANGSQTEGVRSAGAQPGVVTKAGPELQALARLTGKSVDELLAQLGVTPQQLRTEMQEQKRAATQNHQRTVRVLARLTGKSVAEIKAVLKPGVRLEDALEQLGVTMEQLSEAMNGATDR